MKNFYKNKKGITLIALVITIIVLLILAGVTIATITSNESAPNKAVEARQKNEEGAAKDAATLLVAGKIQSYYEAKYVDRTSNAGTILTYLEEELSTSKNVTTDGYKIVVAGGRITATKTGETAAFVQGTVSSEGVITWIDPVPITSIGAFTPANPEVGEGREITLSVAINADATDSVIWSSKDETVATVVSSGQNTATVTGVVGKAGETATITAKNADNSKSAEVTVTVIEAPVEASAKTSYVGYYAEVDGKWGIIYADLLMQKPDSTLSPWGNTNGAWSFPSGTSTNANDYKKYTVSSVIPSGKTTMRESGYELTGVISQVSGSSGSDRFLIMAMDNETGDYTWSDACALTGGTHNTWVLPTKEQWSMFGSAFGVTSSNYGSTSRGLNFGYWSSTPSDSSRAWCTYFGDGYMYYNSKTDTFYVRLCTTF